MDELAATFVYVIPQSRHEGNRWQIPQVAQAQPTIDGKRHVNGTAILGIYSSSASLSCTASVYGGRGVARPRPHQFVGPAEGHEHQSSAVGLAIRASEYFTAPSDRFGNMAMQTTHAITLRFGATAVQDVANVAPWRGRRCRERSTCLVTLTAEACRMSCHGGCRNMGLPRFAG